MLEYLCCMSGIRMHWKFKNNVDGEVLQKILILFFGRIFHAALDIFVYKVNSNFNSIASGWLVNFPWIPALFFSGRDLLACVCARAQKRLEKFKFCRGLGSISQQKRKEKSKLEIYKSLIQVELRFKFIIFGFLCSGFSRVNLIDWVRVKRQ